MCSGAVVFFVIKVDDEDINNVPDLIMKIFVWHVARRQFKIREGILDDSIGGGCRFGEGTARAYKDNDPGGLVGLQKLFDFLEKVSNDIPKEM